MNKTKKRALIISIALVALTVLMQLAVFAGNLTIPTPEAVDTNQLGVGKILGYIQAIGVAVALAMLIIIGIQYVSANAEKRASIKDQAITYVFGAFCIFAAVAILEIIKRASTALTV